MSGRTGHGPSLSRRGLVMAGLAAGAAASAPACAAPAADWPGFRRRFLQADGRVVDIGNGGISHSEGQGTGLLLAAAAGDRESFARIWSWTAVTLRRTQDELFAWRYEPQRGVSDHNNATDGDLLIAWALLRAGRAWREPAYVAAAKATAAAVRKRLIVEHAGGQLLLPGLQGFQAQDGSVVVNPSYLVLPAFAAFARAGFDGDWAAFAARSARFLREVRFGPYDLPIDWVRVDPVGAIWAEAARPPRFGFDAVRAPLYLMWAGQGGEPAVQAALRWWRAARSASGALPAWVDVTTGAVADFPASPGVQAIAACLERSPLPPPPLGDDYYAWALWNLAAIARAES